MAQLDIQQDLFLPGQWQLTANHPAALAATCDAIVTNLGIAEETFASWSLHPDEQTGPSAFAYEDERRELGLRAECQIVELPRPAQQNVVWVDRVHLLTWGVPPTLGTRILGLYVASPGRIVQYLHHPSVSGTVFNHLQTLPHNVGTNWNEPAILGSCRAIISYDPKQPQSLSVRAPVEMAGAVHDALLRLSQHVQHL